MNLDNEIDYQMIGIGASWGGLNAITNILFELPANFPIPIIVVLHRGKGQSSLSEILSDRIKLNVKDIDDKEDISPGTVYLAPPDYHVLIEKNHTFSLDVSEAVNYSRPSIDVTLESVAEVFKQKSIGIILTGANKDGSFGLLQIARKGGLAIIQDPSEAEAPTMPRAAIKAVNGAKILRLKDILEVLANYGKFNNQN